MCSGITSYRDRRNHINYPVVRTIVSGTAPSLRFWRSARSAARPQIGLLEVLVPAPKPEAKIAGSRDEILRHRKPRISHSAKLSNLRCRAWLPCDSTKVDRECNGVASMAEHQMKHASWGCTVMVHCSNYWRHQQTWARRRYRCESRKPARTSEVSGER